MTNFFDGDMSARDRNANAGAKFYAAREPHAPLTGYPPDMPETGQTDETYGPPCVEIGGVQIYAYVRDGILVVSLHFDSADLDQFAVYNEGGGDCVPVIIKTGENEAGWSALPYEAVNEDDARQLRASGDFAPMWVLPDWADRLSI